MWDWQLSGVGMEGCMNKRERVWRAECLAGALVLCSQITHCQHNSSLPSIQRLQRRPGRAHCFIRESGGRASACLGNLVWTPLSTLQEITSTPSMVWLVSRNRFRLFLQYSTTRRVCCFLEACDMSQPSKRINRLQSALAWECWRSASCDLRPGACLY